MKFRAQANGAGTPLPTLGRPFHRRTAAVPPRGTDKGGGDYTVTPLYLFMPGVWQITFFPSATPADTAAFMFCVQG